MKCFRHFSNRNVIIERHFNKAIQNDYENQNISLFMHKVFIYATVYPSFLKHPKILSAYLYKSRYKIKFKKGKFFSKMKKHVLKKATNAVFILEN